MIFDMNSSKLSACSKHFFFSKQKVHFEKCPLFLAVKSLMILVSKYILL